MEYVYAVRNKETGKLTCGYNRDMPFYEIRPKTKKSLQVRFSPDKYDVIKYKLVEVEDDE